MRDLSKRRARWILGGMMAGAVLLRFVFSRLASAPTINSDEWVFLDMARTIPDGQGTFFCGMRLLNPCWLYPLLMSPFLRHMAMSQAYPAIHLMNSFLVTLTAWPVYRLARELGGRRRALAAAALTLLLPGGCYSGTVMTENLYFPLIALAVWLVFRAIMQPGWRRCLAAGLVCGLGFHVRPHGILLIPIVGLTIVLHEGLERWWRRAAFATVYAGLREFLAALVRYWPMAAGWAAVLGLRPVEVYVYDHANPFLLKSFTGYYSSVAAGSNHASAGAIALSFAGHLLTWPFLSGLLPGLVLIRLGMGIFHKPMDRRLRVLVLLAVIANMMLLYVSARFTVNYALSWKVVERYIFIFFPPVIVIFCTQKPAWRMNGWPWPARLALLAALTAVAAGVSSAMRWEAMSDSPTLSGPGMVFIQAPQMARHPIAWILPACYLVPAVAGLALLIFSRRSRLISFLAVGLLFGAGDTGWYAYCSCVHNPNVRECIAMVLKIEKRIGRSDRLFILDDKLAGSLIFHVGAWNHGIPIHLKTADALWYSLRPKLGADGTFHLPDAHGKQVWLLTSPALKLNLKPEKTFKTCALYCVGREPKPLRILGGL